MNIAHIIPSSINYPLGSHNGRYDWVYKLASRQAASGHNVTVYGGAHSVIPNVHTMGSSTTTNDKREDNIAVFKLAFSKDHDVYHSHFDNLHYELAHETDRPIVYTQHWWPTDETTQLATTYHPKNVWAAPPTKFMYDYDLKHGIQSYGYIHHGIDLDLFRPVPVPPSDRLLFVGRISPEKNLDLAIRVAKKANVKLDIIGKVVEKNMPYWQSLLPEIDGEMIRYIGQKSHAELIDLYSATVGVLFPSDINEAFGLVAVEAQACGAPVIMQRGGSRGELIIDGQTGFLCDSEEEYVSAITSLHRIISADCIEFAQQFDIQEMVRKYAVLYTSLIK